MSSLEILVPRPKRWDEPFGPAMTDAAVERLLRIEPFRSIDPAAFPASLPLHGILRNDTRLEAYEPGDVIVREGDYGNSAFLVLDGSVRVALERLDPTLLGRSAPPKKSWLQVLRDAVHRSNVPEARSAAAVSGASGVVATRDHSSQVRVFLQDVPRLLESTGTAVLHGGEIFGELASLTRSPRTATVFAETPALLLEIRWQGLRDLMKRTPALRDHVDRLYRENSLLVQLRETPTVAMLDEEQLAQVAATAELKSFGNFDWYADFQAYRKCDAAERLAAEPLIAAEGEPIDGLFLIRSGFARVTAKRGAGEQTIAYLGKGHVFGQAEALESARTANAVPSRYSLRAVGYVDVVVIPIEALRTAAETIGQNGLPPAAFHKAPSHHADSPALSPRTLDFLADHRIFNGTQTMLIHLDRCTRCDDCVRACAATHDNNPRFVRHGMKHDNLLVANACMHCRDPVCMIGCPTGAIARDETSGIVRINDLTCIGCATCANGCPYNAIGMVEIRDESGAFYMDEATGQPILKATKCDLCTGQLTSPACQQACPHDALVRADMARPNELASWIGLSASEQATTVTPDSAGAL